MNALSFIGTLDFISEKTDCSSAKFRMSCHLLFSKACLSMHDKTDSSLKLCLKTEIFKYK